MDFQYAMARSPRWGDFYRIYPLTSRPSQVAEASSIEMLFPSRYMSMEGGVISLQRKTSSKIGKYREIRFDKQMTRCWKFLKGSTSEASRNWVDKSFRELRNEIKLFRCDLDDMYLFRSKVGSKCCFYFSSDRYRRNAIFLQRKT